MSIQRLSAVDFEVLENLGVRSLQIVWPKNAPEALVTITRVTMEPGSISARHSHPDREQIWIVERGRAMLLMDRIKQTRCKLETLYAHPRARSTASITRGMSRLSIWP